MKVEQLYTGCLAEAAYYIESNGEAAIIDPLRETAPYLALLKQSGAKLKYIFETHFHADFVSGHLDLARETGATIVYGPNANANFDFYEAKDGEEFKIGDVTIVVLHTPGHTMESSTFLLRDEQGKDTAIFTGDTLFLGDVGRPDLAIKQGEITKEDLAGMLYDSLRTKIMPLSDDLIVYPGHGAGSACGKNLSEETVDTLGNQKKTNYALNPNMTKEEFIKEVTAGLMPPPKYFPKNAMLNKTGYTSIDDILKKGMTPLSLAAFEGAMETPDVVIIDTRTKAGFKAGFIPGSVYIGLDGSFAPWAGALFPDLHMPILFVADEGTEEDVVTRLARVGFDNVIGYLEGGFRSWKEGGKEFDTLESIGPKEFADRFEAGEVEHILDVRKPTEYLAQRIKMAENFPLDFIWENLDKLDKSKKYYVHCASGYRSIIASSIMKAHGYQAVVDMAEGWKGILEEVADRVPVTEYACPTTISPEELEALVASVS